MRLKLIFFFSLLIIANVVMAQDTPDLSTPTPIPFEPQEVSIQAEDGVHLVGDFYLLDASRPTVILLHQLYTTRRSWSMLIQPLLDAQFNILAVDLRGYGQSRAPIEWKKAVVDVQLWFDWLRTEGGVRPDAISTLGSSMGSTLAIVGCANDALCKTPIAISPGWNYFGIFVEDSFTQGLIERPSLVIYAQNDRWPAIGVPLMQEAAGDKLTVSIFPANMHGIDLIKQHQDEIIAQIIEWLLLYGI